MSPLPIELITKILKLYFHTDSHSTPLSVQVPSFSLPHAASLRLVHSSFLTIIDGDVLSFAPLSFELARTGLATSPTFLVFSSRAKGAMNELKPFE
jgi:hypothetical protein